MARHEEGSLTCPSVPSDLLRRFCVAARRVRWGRTVRPAREETRVPTNPETGSDVEYEDDGDYTITFSMALPAPTSSDEED